MHCDEHECLPALQSTAIMVCITLQTVYGDVGKCRQHMQHEVVVGSVNCESLSVV